MNEETVATIRSRISYSIMHAPEDIVGTMSFLLGDEPMQYLAGYLPRDETIYGTLAAFTESRVVVVKLSQAKRGASLKIEAEAAPRSHITGACVVNERQAGADREEGPTRWPWEARATVTYSSLSEPVEVTAGVHSQEDYDRLVAFLPSLFADLDG